jgi:hypothetical protein
VYYSLSLTVIESGFACESPGPVDVPSGALLGLTEHGELDAWIAVQYDGWRTESCDPRKIAASGPVIDPVDPAHRLVVLVLPPDTGSPRLGSSPPKQIR